MHLSNGGALPSPQRWTNTVTMNVRTEYKLLGIKNLPGWDLAFRTDYIRSHSPITDLSFDPALPDSDMHSATVGMGFLCHAGGKFFGLIACADSERTLFSTSAIDLDLILPSLGL